MHTEADKIWRLDEGFCRPQKLKIWRSEAYRSSETCVNFNVSSSHGLLRVDSCEITQEH
jgi:hypothetical protein